MQIFIEFEFPVSRFILHCCVFLFVPWDIFSQLPMHCKQQNGCLHEDVNLAVY